MGKMISLSLLHPAQGASRRPPGPLTKPPEWQEAGLTLDTRPRACLAQGCWSLCTPAGRLSPAFTRGSPEVPSGALGLVGLCAQQSPGGLL